VLIVTKRLLFCQLLWFEPGFMGLENVHFSKTSMELVRMIFGDANSREPIFFEAG